MRGTKSKQIRKAIFGEFSPRPQARTYRWDDSGALMSTGLRQAYQQAKQLYKEGLWNPNIK